MTQITDTSSVTPADPAPADVAPGEGMGTQDVPHYAGVWLQADDSAKRAFKNGKNGHVHAFIFPAGFPPRIAAICQAPGAPAGEYTPLAKMRGAEISDVEWQPWSGAIRADVSLAEATAEGFMPCVSCVQRINAEGIIGPAEYAAAIKTPVPPATARADASTAMLAYAPNGKTPPGAGPVQIALMPADPPVTATFDVPLDDLPPDADLPGSDPSPALIDWIRAVGLLHPLTYAYVPGDAAVRPGEAEYSKLRRFIDGRRRIKALRFLRNEALDIYAKLVAFKGTAAYKSRKGDANLARAKAELDRWATVPVLVLTTKEGVSPAMTLAMHATRTENPAAQLQAIEALLELHSGVPENEALSMIASAVKLHPRIIRARLALRASLTGGALALFRAGAISAGMAHDLARLPLTDQDALVDVAVRTKAPITPADIHAKRLAQRAEAGAMVRPSLLDGLPTAEEAAARAAEPWRGPSVADAPPQTPDEGDAWVAGEDGEWLGYSDLASELEAAKIELGNARLFRRMYEQDVRGIGDRGITDASPNGTASAFPRAWQAYEGFLLTDPLLASDANNWRLFLAGWAARGTSVVADPAPATPGGVLLVRHEEPAPLAKPATIRIKDGKILEPAAPADIAKAKAERGIVGDGAVSEPAPAGKAWSESNLAYQDAPADLTALAVEPLGEGASVTLIETVNGGATVRTLRRCAPDSGHAYGVIQRTALTGDTVRLSEITLPSGGAWPQ